MNKYGSRLSDYVNIAWTLGDVCNYECSYCPFNTGRFIPPDSERIKEVSEIIIEHYEQFDKACHFHFTGGEPTIIPNFISVLRTLHNRYCKINLASNGFPPLEWWEMAKPTLDTVHISVHLEECDIEDLEAKFDLLKDRDLKISIAAIPEQWDTIIDLQKKWKERYKEQDLFINLHLLYEDMPRNSRPLNYTQKQLDYLYGKHEQDNETNEATAGVEKEDMGIDQMRVEHRNTFTGYSCYAGIDTLVIDMFGNIRKSHCNQSGGFGNINDFDIKERLETKLPTEPMICEQRTCKNWFDMTAFKEKI